MWVRAIVVSLGLLCITAGIAITGCSVLIGIHDLPPPIGDGGADSGCSPCVVEMSQLGCCVQ